VEEMENSRNWLVEDDAAHICVNFVFLYQLSWLSVWHALPVSPSLPPSLSLSVSLAVYLSICAVENLSNARVRVRVRLCVHLYLYLAWIRAVRMLFPLFLLLLPFSPVALLIETEFIGSA